MATKMETDYVLMQVNRPKPEIFRECPHRTLRFDLKLGRITLSLTV